MVKAVGDDFGTAETRIAGHSLGGIMSTVSTNLIYELAKAGQIKTNQVPSRLALLDTYIGFLKDDEMYETETVQAEDIRKFIFFLRKYNPSVKCQKTILLFQYGDRTLTGMKVSEASLSWSFSSEVRRFS